MKAKKHGEYKEEPQEGNENEWGSAQGEGISKYWYEYLALNNFYSYYNF